MKYFKAQAVAISCMFAGIACAHELYRTSRMPAEHHVHVSTFSYTGLSGPLNWYGLNKSANAICDTGKTQSPIDIDSSIKKSPGSKIKLHIPDMKEAEFENLGTTVEVPASGTMIYGGKKYKLAQFHYHTPSEHRVNGEYFPMEQHMVHEADDGSLAVLAFLLELDSNDENMGPLEGAVFKHIDEIRKPGDVTKIGPLKFQHLTEHLHNNDVYTYTGSLTTPPCSQEISWIISTKPIMINVDTFLKNKKVIKFNSRYTQDTPGKKNLLEVAASELN